MTGERARVINRAVAERQRRSIKKKRLIMARAVNDGRTDRLQTCRTITNVRPTFRVEK